MPNSGESKTVAACSVAKCAYVCDLHSASVRSGSGGSSAPLDFENGIIAPLNFEGNFQYKIMCTKI